MFEKLTPYDAGVIFSAFILAFGAFAPIVSMPVVGTINYVMGGRGDGTIILACAAGIVGLIFAGYRRATAIVGGVTLLIMITTLVRFTSLLSKARADLNHSLKGNPFAGLAKVMTNSVGLEWGWILLFAGGLGVVVFALAAPRESSETKSPTDKSNRDTDSTFSSADTLIAEMVAARKSKDTAGSNLTSPPTFGRRGLK